MSVEPSRAIITQPELERLQRIEAKLREVAGECAECNGDGHRCSLDEAGNVGKTVPCAECADIREALAAVVS